MHTGMYCSWLVLETFLKWQIKNAEFNFKTTEFSLGTSAARWLKAWLETHPRKSWDWIKIWDVWWDSPLSLWLFGTLTLRECLSSTDWKSFSPSLSLCMCCSQTLTHCVTHIWQCLSEWFILGDWVVRSSSCLQVSTELLSRSSLHCFLTGLGFNCSQTSSLYRKYHVFHILCYTGGAALIPYIADNNSSIFLS